LAIGPDGNLYVADEVGNQILQLLPGRGFQVVAGDGVAGFSGDGGPAINAELNRPLGMTFSPSGTLYFADEGNYRVRAISPNGIITTMAGDGHQGSWIADGTSALGASLLGPTAVTFSPAGQLYIADQGQVLRMNGNGTLTDVLGINSDLQGSNGAGGPAVNASADGANGLAFDADGNLYVFGCDDKSLLVVDPAGDVSFPLGQFNFYPRDAGDVVEAPDGSVLAGDVLSLVRLSPDGAQTLYSFETAFLGVRFFEVDGVAESPDGTIYIDTFDGNGYANESAIAAISPNGSATLLWTNS
jgi:sugar lactone lactonase YvrE